MRSVNGVYGFGLTINPSLVLPDPLWRFRSQAGASNSHRRYTVPEL